jgi:hypothetical protein
MKKLATLSICLGSAVATATAGVSPEVVTPVSSGWVGDVNLQLNYARLDGNPVSSPEEDEYSSAYLEFQLGRDFGNYFVQADVFGEMTDAEGSDNNYSDGFGTAVHVLRQTNFGGFGVFGGGFTTQQDENSERLFAGLEAQLNRNEADYYFQLGYLFLGGHGEDEDSINRAFFGRVVAQTELTKCLSLSAEFGGARGQMDGDNDNVTILNAGVALNQKISDSLVASLSYDYIRYDQGGENDLLNEHIVGLGLTYSFGSGSSSTNLSTPRFLRWSGITGGQLE